MSSYKGTIIEESLGSKDVLDKVKILSTTVKEVTDKNQTPWLSQWTMHTIEVPEDKAGSVAEQISKAIDQPHSGSWYVDFKNDTHHYVIFYDKVFYISKFNENLYDEASRYGVSIGIPEYQVDFQLDPKLRNITN